jgi:hypothetical protein
MRFVVRIPDGNAFVWKTAADAQDFTIAGGTSGSSAVTGAPFREKSDNPEERSNPGRKPTMAESRTSSDCQGNLPHV